MSDQKILASSAVMAAGTVVSRMSGFVRSALLVAALGRTLHAELFNVANTVPNMLYILLAGGVFNAVLVPQLVRTMKNDPDGGEAYTNRIVTVAALFLAVVTLVLVLAAPWVMQLFLSDEFDQPELAAHVDSINAFARWCLPQVFFYGMFVLVGQILNARGRFGPMMWAPIANNLIAIATLATYLLVFGPATAEEQRGAFTTTQEALLGLGSTLGIVAQFLVLVPYLRQVGFRFRPRLDLRGAGLGHTARLGVWTLLFVIVNQVAYAVVVRLGTSGPAQGLGTDPAATGYLVYSFTFLIVMVPHSVVTVSLATAILPRLSAYAADGDRAGMVHTLALALRSSLVVIVPFALLLPLVARDGSHVIWGWGAGQDNYQDFAPSLSLFGVGLVFFTVHYLMLRGFYALEQTRTVFLIQCVIAATNITAALLLVREATAQQTSPALVIAYGSSYVVGAVLSSVVLAHRLRRFGTAEEAGPGVARAAAPLAGFLVRLVVVALLATGVAYAVKLALDQLGADPSLWVALLRAVSVTTVDVVAFVLLARLARLREVTSVLETVTRRLPSRGRG